MENIYNCIEEFNLPFLNCVFPRYDKDEFPHPEGPFGMFHRETVLFTQKDDDEPKWIWIPPVSSSNKIQWDEESADEYMLKRKSLGDLCWWFFPFVYKVITEACSFRNRNFNPVKAFEQQILNSIVIGENWRNKDGFIKNKLDLWAELEKCTATINADKVFLKALFRNPNTGKTWSSSTFHFPGQRIFTSSTIGYFRDVTLPEDLQEFPYLNLESKPKPFKEKKYRIECFVQFYFGSSSLWLSGCVYFRV